MQGVGVARKSLAIIVPLWLRIRVPLWARSPRGCYFNDHDNHDSQGVAIREAKICSVLRTSGRRFLSSFVFCLLSFDFFLSTFVLFCPLFYTAFPKGRPKVAQRSPIGRPKVNHKSTISRPKVAAALTILSPH